MKKYSRPAAGGTDPVGPAVAPSAVLWDDLVVTVSVVVATAAPGMMLAGEKDAVHPLGSPVHEKDTEESKEPN
jgi:hypothetical protein